MAIFSLFGLLDKKDIYKNQTKALCRKRLDLLYENLDLPCYLQAHTTAYYREIDLLVWAQLLYGESFVTFLKTHYEAEDMIYRLVKDYAIVLLNGNGFKGPDWSVRILLANLPDEAYSMIGKAINEIFMSYVNHWKDNMSR